MTLHVFQEEEEAVPEEELQEEEQEVETWTGNVKACTCDCESAESPTRNPAAPPAVLLTSPSPPPPPQAHLLHCMPGELASVSQAKFKTLNDEQPSILRLQPVWLQPADGSWLAHSVLHLTWVCFSYLIFSDLQLNQS